MSLRQTILRLLFVLLLSPPLKGGALSWSPNPEGDVAGYRVYYRTAYETDLNVVDVGLNTSVAIPNVSPATKYFVRLTAYNIFGLESAPSPEVTFLSSPKAPGLTVQGDEVVLNLEDKPGGTLELYESDDLKSWHHKETVYTPDGVLELRLLRNPNEGRKFYRVVWNGDTYEGWLAAMESQFQSGDILVQPTYYGYASGSNLTSPALENALEMGIQSLSAAPGEPAQDFRILTFRMRESTRDVHARLEASSDLQTWVPADSMLEEISSTLLGDGTRSLTYREVWPIEDTTAGRRYYRVHYSRTPFPEAN